MRAHTHTSFSTSCASSNASARYHLHFHWLADLVLNPLCCWTTFFSRNSAFSPLLFVISRFHSALMQWCQQLSSRAHSAHLWLVCWLCVCLPSVSWSCVGVVCLEARRKSDLSTAHVCVWSEKQLRLTLLTCCVYFLAAYARVCSQSSCCCVTFSETGLKQIEF